MDLICPECRADLVIADAQNATCAAHDGRYQILFDRSAQPAATLVPASPSEPTPAAPPPAAARVLTVPCVQHPEVQSVTRCRVCSNGVCAVCDFVLPGNVHVCPACLEKEPSTEISTKRRVLMVVGLILAAFCTLMVVMAVSGTFTRTFGSSETANLLLGNALLWPAVAGLVVALTALDRRLRNSTGIWIAVIWNAINLSVFVMFMIIGLTRK